MWDIEEAMYACWDSGQNWDWEWEQCLTEEEWQQRQEQWCWEDNGEWTWSDDGAWGWCRYPWDRCWEEGGEWNWEGEWCDYGGDWVALSKRQAQLVEQRKTNPKVARALKHTQISHKRSKSFKKQVKAKRMQEEEEWSEDGSASVGVEPTGIEDAAKIILDGLEGAADIADEWVEQAVNQHWEETADELPEITEELFQEFNDEVECYWASLEEGRSCRLWDLEQEMYDCWD